MSDPGLAVVALVILVGLVGVLVPVLPGALLVLAAILVWALEMGTTTAWLTLGAAAAFIAVAQVVKYVLPGRRMRDHGVPRSTLLVAAITGIVGFFVIPVLGLFLGFIGGAFVAERRRLGSREKAWPSAKLALKAVGLSILIELAGVLLAAGTWLIAALMLR